MYMQILLNDMIHTLQSKDVLGKPNLQKTSGNFFVIFSICFSAFNIIFKLSKTIDTKINWRKKMLKRVPVFTP